MGENRTVLNEEQFLDKRSGSWKRLDTLASLAEHGIKRLRGTEIVEFVRLYKQTSGDLAFMMSQSSNQDVVQYLNSLVTRSYAILYRRTPQRASAILTNAFIVVAQTFRRRFKPILLAALVFYGGSFFAAATLEVMPNSREYFVHPGMDELFDHWTESDHEARSAHESTMMTAFYASNNPRVGIMTIGIAAGTAGVGSTFILWQNGIILGALAKEMNDVGRLGFLISSIAPHGVSEIGGIFVAGGAGYVLACGLLFPGRRRIADSLKHASRDALILTALALVMIFAAAPIEGFFSFNPAIPQSIKAAFAVLALMVWSAYFIFIGREKQLGRLQILRQFPSKHRQ